MYWAFWLFKFLRNDAVWFSNVTNFLDGNFPLFSWLGPVFLLVIWTKCWYLKYLLKYKSLDFNLPWVEFMSNWIDDQHALYRTKGIENMYSCIPKPKCQSVCWHWDVSMLVDDLIWHELHPCKMKIKGFAIYKDTINTRIRPRYILDLIYIAAA